MLRESERARVPYTHQINLIFLIKSVFPLVVIRCYCISSLGFFSLLISFPLQIIVHAAVKAFFFFKTTHHLPDASRPT